MDGLETAEFKHSLTAQAEPLIHSDNSRIRDGLRPISLARLRTPPKAPAVTICRETVPAQNTVELNELVIAQRFHERRGDTIFLIATKRNVAVAVVDRRRRGPLSLVA